MSELVFEALPLAAPLQRALAEKGYTTPSPIQSAAIPVLLEGNDLLACAQTGTGKTAAFALPILQRLFAERRKTPQYKVRTLVLSPTRELAVQIADSFRDYGKYMRYSLGLVHGGVSQRPQERALQGGLDVLVACPGRLLDLFQQGCLDLSEVDTFVLDEADRMLDMGFIHDIRRIAKELPEDRQTMLFSATMADEVATLAAKLLNKPKEIRIAPAATTAEKVEQKLYFVSSEDKRALLTQMLEDHAEGDPYELRLVFTKTKHGANRLATQLTKDGIPAEAIHGNKSQAARLKALDRFRSGKTNVLVATDVAARGIDVKDVTLVVNYDLPMEPDSYVHRIGRTARAGASGLAVSFCTSEELKLLTAIERLIRQDIPVEPDHNFHAESVAIRYRNASSRKGGSRSGGSADGGSRGGPRGGRGNGNSRFSRSEREERPAREERQPREFRGERESREPRGERQPRENGAERAARAPHSAGGDRHYKADTAHHSRNGEGAEGFSRPQRGADREHNGARGQGAPRGDSRRPDSRQGGQGGQGAHGGRGGNASQEFARGTRGAGRAPARKGGGSGKGRPASSGGRSGSFGEKGARSGGGDSSIGSRAGSAVKRFFRGFGRS